MKMCAISPQASTDRGQGPALPGRVHLQPYLLRLHPQALGLKPEELDPSVTGRVPVYISRDDRYFQDTYQAMPKQGYTALFQRMLRYKNIKVLLNTDYREVVKQVMFELRLLS